MHSFDKDYWEQHWNDGSGHLPPVNPYIIAETRELTPGTALDAGCGTGAEALWLAGQGWTVTGADISAAALASAAGRARSEGLADRLTWLERDLTTWAPETSWDLVVTNYAHPAMPQLYFYRRIAEWVAPGGTLLIVGHLHDHAHGGSAHHPPEEATATVSSISAGLDGALWRIDTAAEHSRTMSGPHVQSKTLSDVVVRTTRQV